jgi:hypothetical protein
MDHEMTPTDTTLEYEQPQVVDFGDLAERTLSNSAGGYTDVPKGTPVTNNIFSPTP